MFLGGFVVIGLGQGGLTTTVNAVIAEIDTKNTGRNLNFLHAVFSFGALTGPFIVARLLASGTDWRWITAATGGIWLAFLVGSLAVVYPELPEWAQGQILDFTVLRHRLLLFLFAIAFIYNGVAWSLLGWLNTYLQEARTFPVFFSTSMISVFYVGLTVGRLSCGMLTERWGHGRVFMVLMAGTAVTYPLVIFSSTPFWIVLAIFSSGLFLSGMYPTALSYARRSFPSVAGTAMGILSLAMTMGTMIPPYWTGIVAEYSNFQIGMALNGALLIPLFWIARTILRADRDEKRNKRLDCR